MHLLVFEFFRKPRCQGDFPIKSLDAWGVLLLKTQLQLSNYKSVVRFLLELQSQDVLHHLVQRAYLLVSETACLLSTEAKSISLYWGRSLSNKQLVRDCLDAITMESHGSLPLFNIFTSRYKMDSISSLRDFDKPAQELSEANWKFPEKEPRRLC